MGTMVQQQVYGIGGMRCAELAAVEIARLEQLWTVFRPDSELSELGRQAGERAVAVSADTFTMLTQAKRLHGMTLGALDVTAGPLVRLWRHAAERGTPPSDPELTQAIGLLGIDDLELCEGRRVRLKRTGQQLDLGALAKGYAADRCVELYRRRGIRHALFDFGGNVTVLGSRPDGSAWRVGIQAPGRKRGEYFGVITACDRSIVTSGSYERRYEIADHRYSHVLSPRTGLPVENDIASITVMHPSSIFAHAIATACMVLGAKRGFELATALEVDMLIQHPEGVLLTPNMRRAYQAATSLQT